MVNRGRSGGCHTCRERRIKCDQGRPECYRCLRVGRPCGGYEPKPKTFRFKESALTRRAVPPQRGGRHPTPLRRQVQPPDEEQARCFFLQNFATLGRNPSSAQGSLFEFTPEILSTERHDSALALAVAAVSMRTWWVWRDPAAKANKNDAVVVRHHTRAIRRLQAAINCPVESKRPGTVLATMTMQFDENLAATLQAHKPTRIHHDGAIALARHQATNSASARLGAYLVAGILHTEVTSAIRQKTVVAPELVDAIMQTGPLPTMASSRLDLIGMSIAALQSRFSRAWSGTSQGGQAGSADDGDTNDNVNIYSGIYTEAKAVRQDLVAWMDSVPSEWEPQRISPVRQTNPPIITYSQGCDVFHTVQIAGIWNTWRCYHLILLKIILAAASAIETIGGTGTTGGSRCPPSAGKGINRDRDRDGDYTAGILERVEYYRCVQELVDAVCDSIPFFLGNCSWRLSFADVTGPTVEFPSYHDLDPNRAAASEPQHCEGIAAMSREEHAQHAIAQGCWHALASLSRLMALFSGPDSWLIAPTLRPGQRDWIREQFRRCLLMMHLLPPRTTPSSAFAGRQGVEGTEGPVEAGRSHFRSDASRIDELVERLTDGMRFTTGS